MDVESQSLPHRNIRLTTNPFLRQMELGVRNKEKEISNASNHKEVTCVGVCEGHSHPKWGYQTPKPTSSSKRTIQ